MRPCPGFGPTPADVFLCGEKIGKEEAYRGKPFVGPAGELQSSLLLRHHLTTRGMYLTNLIKHYIGDRPPSDEEISRAIPEVIRELKISKPKLIIAAGATAARFFLGSISLDIVHGMVCEPDSFRTEHDDFRVRRYLPSECLILPIYNPGLGLRDVDARSLISWDYEQVANAVRSVRKGVSLTVRKDPFAGMEDYQDVDGGSLIDLLEAADPDEFAVDTEGVLPHPFSAQFTWKSGTGYMIRKEAKHFAEAMAKFQRRVNDGCLAIGHFLLHDMEVLREFKLELRRADLFDTSYSAYLTRIEAYSDDPKGRRRSKQGLKPLAYRHNGCLMMSHEDLVSDQELELRISYLEKVASGSWPHPGDIVEQKYDGTWKITHPNAIEKTAGRILADVRSGKLDKDGNPTDIEKRWNDLDKRLRAPVEKVLGRLPYGSVEAVFRVDPKRAIDYGCLSGDSRILTADGPVRIADIVKNRSTCLVESLNLETGERELKPVTGWYRNTQREHIKWLSLETEHSRPGRWGHSGTRYTPDHRLLTDQGWKRIDQIQPGDFLVNPTPALDSVQQQVGIGSVLGDGSISRRNPPLGWPVLKFSNCEKQKNYVEWKKGLLGAWVSSSGITEPGPGSYGKGTPQHWVTTKAHPELLGITNRSLAEWIEDLGPLGLAIFYQDDGTYVKTSQSARLYTHSYPPADLEHIRTVLRKNFRLETTLSKVTGRDQWFVCFGRLESNKLFSIIFPYVHPDMQYKLSERWRTGQVTSPPRLSRGQIVSRVERVYENPAPLRTRGTTKTSYCIDVEGNHNFFTLNGEIAHNCADSDQTFRLKQVFAVELESRGLTDLMRRGMEVLPLFEEMQYRGMPADVKYFEDLAEEMWEKVVDYSRKISKKYFRGKPFNPKSPPQTQELLRLRGLEGKKRTKGGDISTAVKSIGHHRFKDEALEWLFEGREHEHILSSFCAPVLNRVPEGYGERLIWVKGSIQNTRTATRRLAMKEPNLLNIPVRTKQGKRVREGYRTPEGMLFGSWDLSQIEYRILAHFCRDRTLLKLFNGGQDVHRWTASQVFGVPYDRVDKETQRVPAKTTNYLMIYGGTGHGLSDQLRVLGLEGWTVDKCEEFIEEVWRLFPGIPAYFEKVKAETQKTEVSRSWLGMPRYLPGINSRDEKVVDEAVRHAVSQRIQGTAQDMLQNSMIWLKPRIWKMQDRGLEVWWGLQYHDELIFLMEEGIEHKVGKLVVEGLTKHSGIELRVPVEADGHVGRNWGELK